MIVLGDMAGTKLAKPWIVGWPQSSGPTPLGLERTLQAAVRRETHSEAGGPRALGQWIRRALPITVSEQGPIGAAGLPAGAALGVRRARPGRRRAGARHAPGGLRQGGAGRGRRARRAPARATRPAFEDAPKGIVTLRNVLPDWGARLIVGSLLLPALLAALDAFFRARRRRVPIAPWLAWLAVAAVPLPVAWLWLRALGRDGGDHGPRRSGAAGPLPARDERDRRDGVGAAGRRAGVLAARGSSPARCARGAQRRARGQRPPPRGPCRASTDWRSRPGCGSAALAAITWAMNPYAAGVLVLATHLWLFAAGGWRGWPAIAAVLIGLAPIVLVAVYYGLALDLGPLGLAWGAALAAGSGSGLWSTLLLGGRPGRARGRDPGAVRAPPDRARRDAQRRGDQDPRAGQLRRPGLARRHRVGAAPMSDDRHAPQPRPLRAAPALDAADRLRQPAAGRRRGDARVGGAGLLALRPLPAERPAGPARPAGQHQADAGRGEGAQEAARPEAPARVRGPLAGPQDPRRRRRRQDPDRPHRAQLGRRRGHGRRRSAQGPGPLSGHAAARPARDGRRSPGTARPTARRSARSTRSSPATRSRS